MMNIFFDTEFTELSINADLLSIGMVTHNGERFYGVFDVDYDSISCSDFVFENVIPNLEYPMSLKKLGVHYVKGSTQEIAREIKIWLSRYKNVRFWADVPHYDWVLFCELFGGALKIPENIDKYCLDLSSALRVIGFYPEMSTESLIDTSKAPYKLIPHNALCDAELGMMILKEHFNAYDLW